MVQKEWVDKFGDLWRGDLGQKRGVLFYPGGGKTMLDKRRDRKSKEDISSEIFTYLQKKILNTKSLNLKKKN